MISFPASRTRNVEIERVKPRGVSREALFQKPVFIGRQNKEEVSNLVIRTIESIASQDNSKLGDFSVRPLSPRYPRKVPTVRLPGQAGRVPKAGRGNDLRVAG